MMDSTFTSDTPPLVITSRPLSLSEQHLRFDIRPERCSASAIRLTAARANRPTAVLTAIHKPGDTIEVCLIESADGQHCAFPATDCEAMFQEVQGFATQCQSSVMHALVLDNDPAFRSTVLQQAGFTRSELIGRAGRTIDALKPECLAGPDSVDISLLRLDHIQSGPQLLQVTGFPQSGPAFGLTTFGTRDLLQLLHRTIRTSTDLSGLPVPLATHLLTGWAALDADVRICVATANGQPVGILVMSQPSDDTLVAQPVVLEYVAVDPDFRRQKVASGLISAAIRWLRSEQASGPIMVTAFVDAGNRSALGLYRRNQFEISSVGSLWIHRRN